MKLQLRQILILAFAHLDWILLAGAVCAGIYLNWPLISIALLVFSAHQWLRPIPGRYVVWLVAIIWAFIPVAFLLNREVLAGQLADNGFILFAVALLTLNHEIHHK